MKKDRYDYWKADIVSYHECMHCDGTGFQHKIKKHWFWFPKFIVSDQVCGLCNGEKRIEWSKAASYMEQAKMATMYGIYDFKYRDII